MAKLSSPYDPAMAPKDLKFVIYEKKGHVAYITLNRPEVRNALHTFSYREMRACWLDMGMDPKIRVGIVSATGLAFCAGRDVKFLRQYQEQGKRTPHEDPTSPEYFWGGGGMPIDANLEKPLICAVQGFAVGVGLNLFLQCHLGVMAGGAWLGAQHTNVGRMGAPEQIYAALPRATAAYLTLCNGRLRAPECLQQGIVNRVVPKEGLMAAAEELAAMVAKGAPKATQAVVKMMRLTAAFSPELVAFSKHLDRETGESEECAEGARAFNEKRAPIWD